VEKVCNFKFQVCSIDVIILRPVPDQMVLEQGGNFCKIHAHSFGNHILI
jgi:hypothetical protein